MGREGKEGIIGYYGANSTIDARAYENEGTY